MVRLGLVGRSLAPASSRTTYRNTDRKCHTTVTAVTIISFSQRKSVLTVSKTPRAFAACSFTLKPKMASSSSSGPSVPVVFTTQTPYPLPTQKFMIPATWKRFQLSQLINKALSLSTPVPFDFLVKKEVLANSLGEWCAENGVAEVCPFFHEV